MNTGIGDAVNLAWKLAAVLRGRARASLLDTYEPERIAFARRLVATTDRAFTTVTSSGWLARMIRLRIVPVLAPLLFSSRVIRRLMFRTVSQVNVNYRVREQSEPRTRWLGSFWRSFAVGEDRCRRDGPSGRRGRENNFAPLKSLDWQLHVYGGDAAPEVAGLEPRKIAVLHIFPWCAEMKRSGLRRDALYLVRAGWLRRSWAG